MGVVINGNELSTAMREQLKERVERLKAQYGRAPHLAVILVGEDAGSVSYVTGKARAAEQVGIDNTTIRLSENVSESELLEHIERLNENDGIDGILVQLPLPKTIDADRIAASVAPEKDVDGINPLNIAALWQDREGIRPCTPKGVMDILHSAGIRIEGKRAVVVGRSDIVGLPVAKLLLNENATVTIAHSRTRDLAEITRSAEILVVAVGRARIVTGDMISEGTAVIDVGVNRDKETGKLCGDVDFVSVEPKASIITPVPGGVGPMTITELMWNTAECFEKRMNR